MDWSLHLSLEVIGAVALVFFWIHTLLIAGAAWLDLRDLGRLARRFAPLDLLEGRVARGAVRGTVIEGRGPEGELALNLVEQVGRSKGDGVMHFGDAAHRSELFGGELEPSQTELGDDARVRVSLEPAADAQVRVWPSEAARREAQRERCEVIGEAELATARRARGYRHTVVTPVRRGATVWVAGTFEPAEEGEGQWRARGDLLIATIDPRAWIRRKRALVLAFILGELALAGACTTLALWPPLWDWVSMIGGGAALGFFLGVQPVGVAVSEALRPPDRAYLRGRVEPGRPR